MSSSDLLKLPEVLPETSRCFTCPTYKQVFDANQDLRIKLKRAEDGVVYWKKNSQDLLAENLYLKKLHFGRKTEKDAPPKSENQDSTPEDHSPKTHGAQDGHKGSGRSIPFHLPTEERTYIIPPEACFCTSCGLPFK